MYTMLLFHVKINIFAGLSQSARCCVAIANFCPKLSVQTRVSNWEWYCSIQVSTTIMKFLSYEVTVRKEYKIEGKRNKILGVLG